MGVLYLDRTCSHRAKIAFASLLVFSLLGSLAQAQQTTVVVVAGEAAPDGNGVFQNFGPAKINEAGRVAFAASLTGITGGVGRRGLYVWEESAGLAKILRTDEAALSGGGTYTSVNAFEMNSSGDLAFHAYATRGTPNPPFDDALLVTGGGTQFSQLARTDQPPNAAGLIYERLSSPRLNDRGQLALIGRGPESIDDDALYSGDSVNGVRPMAVPGQLSPASDGEIIFIASELPALNELGQVAYLANINQRGYVPIGPRENDDYDAILLTTESGGTSEIARTGLRGVAGPAYFTTLSDELDANDRGQVAFRARRREGSGPERAGLYVGDGTATAVPLVREGQTLPGTPGTVDGISWLPEINERGQVAFAAEIRTSTAYTRGLYRSSTDGGLEAIAVAGQPTPNGDSAFLVFHPPVINEAGQIAFAAQLRGGTGEFGLYFYDDELGLLEIARNGDSLLGSTLFDRYELGETYSPLDFNELGEVAYRFELTDGRFGIALWSPPATVPEPASVVLGSLVLVLGCWVRGRRAGLVGRLERV